MSEPYFDPAEDADPERRGEEPMRDCFTPPFKVITAAMLKAGWYAGPESERRAFEVIRRNDDGTYVVENPELTIERERLKAGGELR